MHNFLGLGIGIGRFVLILVCFYFVAKLAVKKELKNTIKKTKKEVIQLQLQFVNLLIIYDISIRKHTLIKN